MVCSETRERCLLDVLLGNLTNLLSMHEQLPPPQRHLRFIYVKIDPEESGGADSPAATAPSVVPPSIVDLTVDECEGADSPVTTAPFPDSVEEETCESCSVLGVSRVFSVYP